MTGGKPAEDAINQNMSEWRGRLRLAWVLQALSVLVPPVVGVVAALLLAEALGNRRVPTRWAGFTGADRLEYRAYPAAGSCFTTTVTITVR